MLTISEVMYRASASRSRGGIYKRLYIFLYIPLFNNDIIENECDILYPNKT